MGQIFTRQELYDLVWSEPMRHLCKKYHISDRGLAKACGYANIPVPERGYWNKLQARHKVTRRPLPSRDLGVSDEVRIGLAWYEYPRKSDDEIAVSAIPPIPVFNETLEAITERVKLQVRSVPIPRSFDEAFIGIRKLLDQDEQRRAAMVPGKYIFASDKPCFDAPFERRRLRILNALFLRASRMGHSPSINGKTARQASLRVGDQSIGLSQEDSSERNETSIYDMVDRPKPASTPMTLKVTSYGVEIKHLCWCDKGEDRIEDHLAEILTALIVAGEAFYRERLISRREHLIAQKEQLIEQRRQQVIEVENRRLARIAAEEKARIDHLLAQADAFRQAMDIRTYVEQVQISLKGSVDEAFKSWAEWALAEANRIDPVRSGAYLSRAASLDHEEEELK